MLFVFLGDFSGGKLRYSNSEVTETVDFVFTVILDLGDTSVTLIGILRSEILFFPKNCFENHKVSVHMFTVRTTRNN